MMCPKCGVELKEDVKVCVRCGFILSLDESGSDKPSQKRYQKLNRYFFPVFVLLLIGCFIGFFFYQNYEKERRIIPISELEVDEDSIHFVNSFYLSDGRYYTYLLDDYQKEVYEKLLKGFVGFEEYVYLDTKAMKARYKKNYVLEVGNVLALDHPELIQMAHIEIVKETIDTMHVKLNYAFSKEEMNEKIDLMIAGIDKVVLETKGMNDYDKAKYVYDFLAGSNTYGSDEVSSGNSAISCFDGSMKPNSFGFAKASQILLQNAFVDSILVRGFINDSDYMWNFVKLEDGYYYFDVGNAYSSKTEGYRYDGFLSKKHGQYSLSYQKMVPWIKGRKYLK